MPKVEKQSLKQTTKGESVLDRIAPIEFEDEGLKLMVYGQSGSGKTTFAATFPGPILWIICSGGSKSGELRSVNTPEYRKKIKKVVLNKAKEIEDICDHIEEAGTYKTVVLDHVSGLQDLTLKEITGVEEMPEQKGWGFASQQQYGASTLQCKTLLRRLLNLSCHVVIVGQERTFDDGEENRDEAIRPSVACDVTKSLVRWLNPAVDYAVQMFKRPKMEKKVVKTGIKNQTKVEIVRGKGVEYCMRAEPHDVFYTKFRVPKGFKVPDIIVDPEYQRLIDIINGKG